MALRIVIAACLLVGFEVRALAEMAQGETLLLRSNTQLVQVNVVVHNRKGEPVEDLKKEDFSLTERGKLQAIRFFSVESTGKLTAPAVKLPPHVFSNRFNERGDAPSSVTVILLDSLNTEMKDQIYAKEQLIRFLQQIRAEDRVAIYTLGRGLKILHDYTSDSAELVAKLAKFGGQNLPDLAASQANAGALQAGLDFLAGSKAEADFHTSNRTLNTLKALEAIAQHLASVPGRKNLIWLSGGFPLQMGFDEKVRPGTMPREQRSFFDETMHTVRAMNNANVAIYPVDARGLLLGPDFAGLDKQDPARRGVFEPLVSNVDTMKELANRTGGQASYNGNDLDKAIRNAIEDAKVTYTLGYYPDTGDQDDRFREIKIKVERAGVTARYRRGYYALREVQQDAKSRKAQLASAAWSPLDATAVTLNARVNIVKDPPPDTVTIVAQVDVSTLRLEQKDEKWVGKVDLIFVQKDEQGRPMSGITDSVDLNLPRESYLKILKTGLIYQRSFPRNAKAESLRIAVRDVGSGSAGSVTVPLSRLVN
ncbi:MAG: VWA domain-containing protein [Bryobacteraceae bacterium]